MASYGWAQAENILIRERSYMSLETNEMLNV